MALKLARDLFRNWIGGVITSLRAEDLPQEASPRGRNSTLIGVGLGKAVVGKRRGGSPLLLAAESIGTISPAPSTMATVHSQHAYRRVVSGTYTYTHLAVQKETGDLYTVTPAGVSTAIGSGTFGANGAAPGWITFKNLALGFAGSVRKKVLAVGGTLTVQNLGLVRPPARATGGFNWNAAFSGVGSMSGTYEVALSFYNENALLHSSRSNGYTPAAAASNQLTVSWVTSPDSQITHVRVHLRKTGLNADFLEVTSGTNYVAGKGVPVGSASTVLDLTDAQILLLSASPDAVENNPPAADGDTGVATDSLYGAVVHGSRVVAWSKTGLYYSKFDQPEQFDPESYEPVNPDDGQELVACHRINDDLVVVFKRRSMYGLVGNDPNSWRVQLLDPSVGCLAPTSVVTIEGKTYWWSELGPMVWDGVGPPLQIGQALFRDTVDTANLNAEKWAGIVTHVDPPRQQVVFWVPEAGSTVNNKGLPFNYRLQVWESDEWDPFDVASAVTGEDADGRPVVYLGGYYGRIYAWWTADVDGARLVNTALSGFDTSGTVFSSTTTQITLAGTVSVSALFVPHQVVLTDSAGTVVRRRITAVAPSGVANTATLSFLALPTGFTPTAWMVETSFTLTGTISAAVVNGSYSRVSVEDAVFDSDLTGHAYAYVESPGGALQRRRIVATGTSGTAGYLDLYPVFDFPTADAVNLTVNIGAPCFEWDTRWADSGDPFRKKRYHYSHVAAASGTGATTATLEIYASYDTTTPVRTRPYTVNTAGTLWDEGRFDIDTFLETGGRNSFRTAVGHVANAYRLRVRNCEPNRPFILLSLGMDASILGDRR